MVPRKDSYLNICLSFASLAVTAKRVPVSFQFSPHTKRRTIRDASGQLEKNMTTYKVFEPPSAETADSVPTYSSLPPKVTETSSTSRTTFNRIPSSISTDIPAQSDAPQFTFIELHDDKKIFPLREDHFLRSDFAQICAAHDCQADCFNMTRVFSASQYALANSTDGYEVDIPVTLFGICSNLANATESAARNGNESTASFFPRPVAEISNDSDLLAANLTTCLATTCEMTRRPSECVDYCGPESLLQSPTEFDFGSGLFRCANKLCSNTCGLPFADQDVFGIGVRSMTLSCKSWSGLQNADSFQVLISYYVQAVLLLALAAAVSASATWQLFRYNRSPQVVGVSKRTRAVLKKFLATECYFGGEFSHQ